MTPGADITGGKNHHLSVILIDPTPNLIFGDPDLETKMSETSHDHLVKDLEVLQDQGRSQEIDVMNKMEEKRMYLNLAI